MDSGGIYVEVPRRETIYCQDKIQPIRQMRKNPDTTWSGPDCVKAHCDQYAASGVDLLTLKIIKGVMAGGKAQTSQGDCSGYHDCMCGPNVDLGTKISVGNA
jgi:hypothetical protein